MPLTNDYGNKKKCNPSHQKIENKIMVIKVIFLNPISLQIRIKE